MDNPDSYRCDSVEIDGEETRMYGPENGPLRWPSVTEILDSRPTPEKDAAIEGWRGYYDGSGDKPHWSEILDYASWRNSLIHYKILDRFTDEQLMGDDEVEAYAGLKNWEYQQTDALAKAKEEIGWAIDAFDELAPTWDIAEYDTDGNIVNNNVRDTERAVGNDEVGYAGRFDVSWQMDDGRTVVGDLKASKADSVSDLIDKKFPRYAMQLAAYANAVTYEVDELAVVWIAPDSYSAEVIPTSMWPRERSSYEADFLGVAKTVNQERLDTWSPADT
jgi:hypothetical protein